MGRGGGPIRFAAYPFEDRANPYVELFQAASALHGVQYVERMGYSDRWLDENAARLDGIHIHWGESLWRAHGPGRLARLHGLLGLARFLGRARRLGLLRVSTMHNLDLHETQDWIDRAGLRLLARRSDVLVCHSREAADELARRDRPPGRVVVMRFGSPDGVYPPPRPREVVRRELGIDPARPVVCCLGMLREYKGIDVAIEATRRLAGAVTLVIGGAPHADFALDALHRDVASASGTVLLDRFLSNQELADLAGASDLFVLPYRRVTGSSAVFTAWALGLVAVASDLPFFREVLEDHPQAGRLFRAGDAAACADAIRSALASPAAERRRAALDAAAAHGWDRAVEPFVRAIFTSLEGDRCETRAGESR
jgi:glycosyltransferase involved in cell wall biosynthesis